MRKRSRFAWLLGSGLVLVAIFLSARLSRDDMGSDADFDRIVAPLRPKPIETVEPSQNAYLLVDDPAFYIPGNELAGRKPVTAHLLQRPQTLEALILAEQTANLPYYQDLKQETQGMDNNASHAMVGLARLLAARARVRFSTGDWQEGLADIRRVEHLGVIHGDRGFIEHWRMGNEMLEMGEQALQAAFRADQIPAQMARQITRKPVLDRRSVYIEIIRRYLQREVIKTLRSGNQVGPGGPAPGFFSPGLYAGNPEDYGRYDRMETVQRIAQMVDTAVKELLAPTKQVPSPLTQMLDAADMAIPLRPRYAPGTPLQATLPANIAWRARIRMMPNGRGMAFVSYLYVLEFDNEKISERFRIASQRATRILAALSAFRQEQGREANSLTELVTRGFMRAYPLDPYDGLPLRYSASRGAIWSVANDVTDQGGDAFKDFLWSTKSP
ncbi:MAG: hypothetical protein ACOYON_11000 [Fimbriimonas sp.]